MIGFHLSRLQGVCKLVNLRMDVYCGCGQEYELGMDHEVCLVCYSKKLLGSVKGEFFCLQALPRFKHILVLIIIHYTVYTAYHAYVY